MRKKRLKGFRQPSASTLNALRLLASRQPPTLKSERAKALAKMLADGGTPLKNSKR